MQKIRVSEIADEAGISNKEVIEKANEIGFEVKAANSAINESDANVIMQYIFTGNKPKSAEVAKPKKEIKKSSKAIKKPEAKIDSKDKIKSINKSKKLEIKTTSTKAINIKKEAKIVKTEDKQQTDKKMQAKEETLSIVGIKRKGIRFVKRAKTEIKKSEKSEKNSEHHNQKLSNTPSLKELFSNEETPKVIIKPKQKSKKKTPAHTQDHGTKLDIARNMVEVNIEDDTELMLDLHEDVLENTKKEEKKSFDKTKTTRQNTYMPRPTIRRGKSKKRKPKTKVEEIIDAIEIPKEIRVYEFAEACGKSAAAVITVLFGLGKMVTKNDFLEEEEIEIVAEDFEISVTYKEADEALEYINEKIDTTLGSDERAPIVTIMGHVDHGKTSLLDYIKNTKVVDGEAGGITQHIGAYQIERDGKKITFIDTPGHEAFSAMRSRGASITDIIIIVIAADDGVKPQTIEAIAHAKSSGVPIIVAINKIDKKTANIELVKTQMAEHEIMASDWGGDCDFIGVSAHSGEGIDELIETILLQSELLELKADRSAQAQATVVESSLEKGKGAVATVIMQNGTLKVGQTIVADSSFGKVRAIIDDNGKNVKELGLSQPGQILGLSTVPEAGSVLVSMENEKEARETAAKRVEAQKAREHSKSTKVSIEELSAMVAEGKIKSLPIILKADVQGSLEALKSSLLKLKNEEVKINIIHSAVGGITESDIALANASENSIILGFNVRPTGSVKKKAKAEGVEIKTYSIIYALLDDIKELLSGMMSPIITEENTGQAEVREVFSINGVGSIAGCFVNDGTVIRGGLARVIRDGVVIHDNSNISSLKRFKDEVKDVSKGYECGIMLEDYNDVKIGDVIETYKEVENKAKI